MPENTVIGKGLNVIRSDARSQGVVRYLKTPMDVMNLMRTGNLENTVVLARAGTVTFVGPVLPRKPAGIITIEGAPQSHLGILAREFGLNAVMSIDLVDSKVPRMGEDGVTSEQYIDYAAAELDGRPVILDCSDADVGIVLSAG
jgi:signal transduction protein with GAF and PtsI domain